MKELSISSPFFKLSDQNVIKLLGGLLTLLLLSLVYTPLSSLGFASPDDRWMLLTNHFVSKGYFGWAYLRSVFGSYNDIQYSPVNTIYYFLIFRINGYDPYYFHLFSFLFHFFNTAIVFVLAKKILNAFAISNVVIISCLTTIVWAVHPLNVESVVWISASKVVLFTFFSLLSLWAFIDGFLENKNSRLFISMILFAISCCCKEQSIVTPFMFILFSVCYHWLYKDKKYDKVKLFMFFCLLIAVSVLFAMISIKANAIGTAQFKPIARYPFYQRVILSAYCISFYLTNLALPINLHYHYPFPVLPFGPMPLSFYLYTFTLIMFSIILIPVVLRSVNFPFYFFCIGIFFLQIFLVLQIIPMTRPAIMADRYMYIPSFPLLMMLISICHNDYFSNIRNKKLVTVIPVLMIVFISYLAIYSNHLVQNWTNINLIK